MTPSSHDESPPPRAEDDRVASAESSTPRIGIFDSGVGGLSILQAVRAQLPAAEFLYVADTGHAPYGERSEAYICDRSRRIAGFLRAQGAEVVVVACNTATAAAVAALRATWPEMAIVGVEPGIKPAVALSPKRCVGVLATLGTLASDKFRQLAATHAGDARLVLQPCPGLATAIEITDARDAGLPALVERYCEPLRRAEVDVAVLGCTHYVFARAHFARALPGVMLLDTAQAVARQTARLARPAGSATEAPARLTSALAQPASSAIGAPAYSTVPDPPGRLRAWSSGDPGVLAAFASHWLGLALHVDRLAD